MNQPQASLRAAVRELRIPILAVLFAFAVGVVAMLLAYPQLSPAERDGFWAELGKAGMQTIVVAAVGGIVTAALKYVEDQRAAAQNAQDAAREDARQRNEYRLELLRRLRSAYSEIKRVRRQLQIGGFTPGAAGPLTEARAKIYVAGMARLGEVKLELEAIRDELAAGVGAEGSTGLISYHIEELEHYLDPFLAGEYRAVAAELIANPEGKNLGEFVQIQEFTAPAELSFGLGASEPYRHALAALVGDILTPRPTP